MNDEQPRQSTDEKRTGSGGVDLRAGTRRVQVDRETVSRVLDYIGRDLRYVVLAVAFAITIISICYGISLIWT